jgi:hypothetical protein
MQNLSSVVNYYVKNRTDYIRNFLEILHIRISDTILYYIDNNGILQ